jgi:hypothetical protein
MLLGEIDRVDTHFVATKFAALVLPTGTQLVTSMDISRSGNVTTMRWTGVPLRLSGKSILLAYLRVWPWFLGLAWPFLTHYGENVNAIPSSVYYTSLGWFALALLALVPGRLGDGEKRRLRALRGVTQMAVDPKRLTSFGRESLRLDLEPQLSEAKLPMEPRAAMLSARNAPLEVLPLLHAYACASDGAEWREVAEESGRRLSA